MTLKHWLPAFCLIIAGFLTILHTKINSLQVLNQRTSSYNETIDNATDDSLNRILEVDNAFNHTLNLEVGSDVFFKSLYAGFGVSDSKTGMQQLQMYIPVLLLTDEDGFYIMYHSMGQDGGYSTPEWTSKLPYFYSGTLAASSGGTPQNFIYQISYTMSKLIKLNLQVGGKSYYFEGHYDKIEKECENEEGIEYLRQFMTTARESGRFLHAEKFNEFRQSVMIYQITKKMNYYVNQHNRIARAYGISYEFSLPESAMDTFARTISDVSLLAIFQGYPYGIGTDDVYSRFSVSGARIYKAKKFYNVQIGGTLYYHRANCKHIQDAIKNESNYESFDTKRQAASKGAFPCPDCKP